jgi:hypothetical protein
MIPCASCIVITDGRTSDQGQSGRLRQQAVRVEHKFCGDAFVKFGVALRRIFQAPSILGDHAGQRNAEADGAAPLPLRLHHERAGTSGRGGGALFKVRFLSMTADQIAKAFRRAFGAHPPGFLLKLSGLTPADFATASRKASVLGERDPGILTKWLETEAQAKPDAGRPRIGF